MDTFARSVCNEATLRDEIAECLQALGHIVHVEATAKIPGERRERWPKVRADMHVQLADGHPVAVNGYAVLGVEVKYTPSNGDRLDGIDQAASYLVAVDWRKDDKILPRVDLGVYVDLELWTNTSGQGCSPAHYAGRSLTAETVAWRKHVAWLRRYPRREVFLRINGRRFTIAIAPYEDRNAID